MSFKEFSTAQEALRGERLWQERAGTEARKDMTEDSSRLPGKVTNAKVCRRKKKTLKLHCRSERLSNFANGYQQGPAGCGGFDVAMGCRFSAGGRGEIKLPADLRHSSRMLEASLIFRAGLW